MKKITFVTYTTSGKYSETIEFDDTDTDDDINKAHYEWMLENNDGYWMEDDE